MIEKVAEAKIHTDGYLELRFLKEDITLEKEDVTRGWNEALQLDPEKKLPVFLITAKWSLIDKSAISVVLNEVKSRSYVAIFVHNLSQRILGNFTLNLAGKKEHVKMFSRETEAREWLMQKIGSIPG